MAQLTQRRYTNIPDNSASQVVTTGPVSTFALGSNMSTQAINFTVANLTRDQFAFNPLSRQYEFTNNYLPFPGITGVSSVSGPPSSFGVKPAATFIKQSSFSNKELTNATLYGSGSYADFYTELYKPDVNGVSTNASTYAVSQITSYKTVWDDSLNRAVLQDTSTRFAGYTFAFDKMTYIQTKQNQDIAFRSGSSTNAALQMVSDFYGKGVKVPANSYGSYKADDGKSYVRTGGGDNWANTSFSVGKITGNVVPIIATPTSSIPRTFSSSVYSSGYTISNTSKVYSIR